MAEFDKKKFDQNDTDLDSLAERLGRKTPPQASPADDAARVVARRGTAPEAASDAQSHPSITRAAESQPESQYIAQHTVASGETLSHIALKYYGSAVREAWMHIYEANKALIGPNPGIIRPGMVLNIPPKPAL